MRNSTSLLAFNRQFPSERICKEKFKEYRLKIGIKCPHCGCMHHYWIGGTVQRFQCKNCGYRQSLKANTVMHHSRLSFRYWFITMWLIVNTKNTFSAAEIQRQLGHKYYRPIFLMLHKIRKSMGNIENSRVLSGEVEIDEAFFSTYNNGEMPELNYEGKRYKHKTPYRMKKTQVVVMCESKEARLPKKGAKITKIAGNLKMIVVPDLKYQTITNAVNGKIDSSSIVISDGTHAHKDFPNMFQKYIGKKINPEDIGRILPYVHIAIGNAKAQFRNIHHAIEKNYLQMYLNEFVWKWNRRKSDRIFNEILETAVLPL